MKTLTKILGTAGIVGTLGLGVFGLDSITKPKETYSTACETFQGYQNIKEGSGVVDRIYVSDPLPKDLRGFKEPEISVLGRADILESDSLEIGKNYTFEIGKYAFGPERLIKALPCEK